MGKNNQQRRAAKRKTRAAHLAASASRHPNASEPSPAPADSDITAELRSRALLEELAERVERLVNTGAALAFGPRADPRALDDVVDELIGFRSLSGPASSLPDEYATNVQLHYVSLVYEHGWQPADVVHAARREFGRRTGRLVAALLAAHHQQSAIADRAPTDWLRQLEALPSSSNPARPGGWLIGGWQSAQGTNPWDGWHDSLPLIGWWPTLTPLPALVPSPSKWPAGGAPSSAAPSTTRVRSGTGHDPKMLSRIRALLGKAERTEFPEEADLYTAKAQDLMSRYAIDEALLGDHEASIDVRSRRIHIDNPYAATKAQLLSTVGKVNRVKVLWDDRYGIATAVGMAVDIDLVEMLFTSLLVQATRAMTEAGAATTGGHRLDRSPSFRRAFLLSYAVRTGELLGRTGEQAQQQAAASLGTDLVPVLARQSAAVEQEFNRLFPNSTRSRGQRVDARGWRAGRAAADRAVLPAGQLGS